jgi:hypothetical protein
MAPMLSENGRVEGSWSSGGWAAKGEHRDRA